MAASPWFLSPPGPDGTHRLFCLPFAGGGASAYAGWNDAAGDSIEVLPIQLPGHETRMGEAPVADMETLASMIVTGIAPLTAGPWSLFGHSMGVLLALCVVRAARRAGLREPERLFVAAKSPPQLPLRRPPFAHLPDDRFLAELQDRYGSGIGAARMELILLMLPTIRADILAVERWHPGASPPLAVPITAFYAGDDPSVSEAEMAAWEAQTSSGFSLVGVAGDHFFLQSARDTLVATVRSELLGAHR